MHKFGLILLLTFLPFILWILYLANTGQSSIFFEIVKATPYGDKIGHVILFGLLTLFANIATGFRKFSIYKLHPYIGSLTVLLFVTIEELSQFFIPSRTLDIYDYSANVSGILLFTLLSIAIEMRNNKSI